MILKAILRYSLMFLFFLSISGCISSRLKVERQPLNKFLEDSETFRYSFTGFSLYDPVKKEYVFEHNSEKFFTPASNTKIFTLYTTKSIFPDSIPGMLYGMHNDTLYFTGTGDPTLLDADFPAQPVVRFLEQSKHPLVYVERDFYDERFGPGWSWDDYMYYFSPEKSSMPIFANLVHFNFFPEDRIFSVNPPRFTRSVMHIRDTVSRISRYENENLFSFHHGRLMDTIDHYVPFQYSTEIFVRLLSDTLKKPVISGGLNPPEMLNIVYSQPTDSLMKKLMISSDNFIAEQSLLMGAGVLFDSLRSELCILYALEHLFPELKDQVDWVDGSGLSIYNKFTPNAMVTLLSKILEEYPRELIRDIFPTGGISGTLKNNFRAEVPYIIAKTGSLSNVYNLSGFLLTKKGEWLIFSFMNNNFEAPVGQIKSEMEKVLWNIHTKY